MKRGLALLLPVLLITLGAAGCASTMAAPTPTPVAAIATSSPSATPLPPTATPLPPTHTPLPPTATPLPPTATPLPPTPTAAPTDTPAPTATLDPTVFALRSPAFGMEGPIPVQYTCNGKDISPPLEWGDPPTGTQSFVLLVDDISAGDLVHWVFFNIPPDTRSLPEGVPKRGHLADGSQQGTNNALEVGYFGPCPLPGPNRYRFRLFALDTLLDLEDGVMKIPVKQAMRGHILAETELIGVFGR